uniref:Reverse transcriptase domain-containing protein n=1 Tax=Tanacetum cinerariifolium TaxID=118510 RepID=A0A699H2B2_TANCI|nr:reverse transcriptase domain-containing protein [Tanacetum cinerariifolium]
MSSPNHPTFDIEDAFSFKFLYYFPATLGNTSPDSSNDLTKYLLATIYYHYLIPEISFLPRRFHHLKTLTPIESSIPVSPSSSIGSSSPIRMAPKRTSTSATPAMNQAAIRNPKPREAPIARKCSYKEFISCQPFNFKGSEGAVGLICWFERTKSVFSCSNCTEDCKVKFATDSEKMMEAFSEGLPRSIKGNVTASKPQTL